MVLITAVWEAFCEDLAVEALEHLVTNVKNGLSLPEGLRKDIAKEIGKDKHELAPWCLADTGWRELARKRLQTFIEATAGRWNSPKSSNVNTLFKEFLGFEHIPAAWKWKKMSTSTAAQKLDGFIATRGEIAHRGQAPDAVRKLDVTGYLKHVKRLVEKTEAEVNTRVKESTGKPLYE